MSLILMLAAPAARAEVVIFAAASLKEPLDQIAAEFDDVVVSYGGSGTLARQVSLGAPADIVLLANTDWMDVLVDGGHVDGATVVDFASNRLVLVGAQGAVPVTLEADAITGALGEGRLAVGLTATATIITQTVVCKFGARRSLLSLLSRSTLHRSSASTAPRITRRSLSFLDL